MKKPAKPASDAVASKAAARSTSGRPAAPPRDTARDALAEQAQATQALVEAMPWNANKALEIGRDNAVHPPAGLQAEPASAAVTASTLSESNPSDKTGSGTPPIGVNATIGSLDRVRADAGGQVLTTNQGVAIADNQNSLKAGLRGPTLLEDFILREKITHFDHERIPERIVHARGSAAHGYFEAYAARWPSSRAPRPSPKPASARRCSCASPPWPASAARPTPRATCAASPSSSTPTKATGTWSATTSRCSSSRTR